MGQRYVICDVNLFTANQNIYLMEDNKAIHNLRVPTDEDLGEYLCAFAAANNVDHVYFTGTRAYVDKFYKDTESYINKNYAYKNIQIGVIGQ